MIDSAAFPPVLVITGKAVREDDADLLINLNNRRAITDTLTPVLQCNFCFCLLSAGQWSATGKTLVVRNSTTHPWTLGVSVQRLTLHPGWNPLLRMRWPSRPRAAPRTCGGRTQTRTWPRSPCSDSPERSVSRCDRGGHVDPGRTGDRLPFLVLEACYFLSSARPSMNISL